MKQHILYIIENETFGGGENVFLQLAKNLDKKIFEPAFVCAVNDPLASDLMRHSIPIIPLHFNRRFSVSTIFKLVKIFKDHRPDIVHSQGGRVDLHVRIALALIKPKFLKPKLISTIACPVEEYDVPLIKLFFYVLLDRLFEPLTDYFLTVTDSLKYKIVKKHRIEPERIKTIYNGIELDDFNQELSGRSAFRKEFGISENTTL